jgi:hypothetical protein
MDAALDHAPPRADGRSARIAWQVLACTAAGAAAGFLVGGVGGRLAMLLLRLTSPDFVVGMTSDDGFEIGVVTTATIQLFGATTAIGGLNGAAYAAVRDAIPRRLRLPLWSLLGAAVGGAAFVHDDGVDFTLLEPAVLGVALFVALPGAAAALVVVLAERWAARPAWRERRLAVGLVLCAAASTIALAAAAVVAVAGAALSRWARPERLRPVARVLVPLALVAVSLVAAVVLALESAQVVGG